MGKVSKNMIEEIEVIAKEYMTQVKGDNLTEFDLMVAENLVMFGYLKAKKQFIEMNKNIKKIDEA
ncbi:MAG: hypothetical protein QY331_02385 [Melioribacteraceae bacterium]|nr:MAG: hypothetical protein QY331_02385 [Melioribacteraceae bacterium]